MFNNKYFLLLINIEILKNKIIQSIIVFNLKQKSHEFSCKKL